MKKLLVGVAFGCLYGCGTEGIVVPPSTANKPPVFTSAATANLVENIPLSYPVSATDSENQPLTYSIAGGADAAVFAINASGVVSLAAQNFDNPADMSADNVYQVTLAVSDGTTTTTQAFAVTVINSREGIAVRRIFTGFTDPVAMVPIPGDTRLFVAERDGSIWYFDPATNTRSLYVRAAPFDPIGGPQSLGPDGLLAMVPSASFATDGDLFVALNDSRGNIQVRRFVRRIIESGLLNNSAEVLTIARGAQAPTAGAWLGIGPDNEVYLATGDAGGPNDPTNSAQNDGSRYGKLIRIRRNPDPNAGASPVFYFFDKVAKGLRQPSGGFFSGSDLYIGDRGQTRFGELNRIAVTQSAVNFGWPFREGNVENQPSAPIGLIDPLLQVAYGTGPKQGSALVVGRVFTTSIPELQSRLVFGDLAGSIWTVEVSRLTAGTVLTAADYERRNEDFQPDVGTISGIAAFASGLDGRAYMLDRDGELFEIISG